MTCVPTMSPRLLMLPATLCPTAPGKSGTDTGVPLLSQNTACVPPGVLLGGNVVFEHNPETPTAWPASLMPSANETVSPGNGLSGCGIPLALHITAENR